MSVIKLLANKYNLVILALSILAVSGFAYAAVVSQATVHAKVNIIAVSGGNVMAPGNMTAGNLTSALIMTPSSLDFGSVRAGSSAYRLITITNNGTTPLVLHMKTSGLPKGVRLH